MASNKKIPNTEHLADKATRIVEVYDTENSEWATLVNPSKMVWNVYDLDAGGTTGRTITGKMLRDRVAVKEKIEMEFPPMEASDFTEMLRLVAGQSFQCRYYSLKTGSIRVAEMYVGDRTASAYNKYKRNEKDIYTDVKFNFIEI